MSYMVTIHGDTINLASPRTAPIKLETIAAQLAGTYRYNGATRRPVMGQPGAFERRPLSVAEHSLLTLEIAERDLGVTCPATRLATLMHDAHEAYLGDRTTPYKQACRQMGDMTGADLLDVEWENAIALRFGYFTARQAGWRAIKHADLTALSTEMRDLLPPAEVIDRCVEQTPPAAWANLLAADPHDEWEQRFYDAAQELIAEIQSRHV